MNKSPVITSGATHVIVCGSIQQHRVVVPASCVDVIGEHRDAEREGGRITDVATILGVAAPRGPRRALRVVAGEAAWLVMGDRVAVRSVPREAFGAFPGWLSDLGIALPFAGLVELDGAFALELDLTRLVGPEVP